MAPLAAMRIDFSSIASKVKDAESDGHEIAIVERAGKQRGIASLRIDESDPVVEWASTAPELCAAYARALKRCGWKGSQTLAMDVYGSAS